MPQIVVEPAEQYHAKTDWISRTMLKDFRKSRRLFEKRYILQSLPEEPPSDAMVKGSAEHAVLLDGKSLEDCFTIIPPEVLNKAGGRSGAKWKEWSAANADKAQLKEADVRDVIAAIEAALKNPVIQKLRTLTCLKEVGVYWENELKQRMRADWLIIGKKKVRCIDWKFVYDASPEGFTRQVEAGLWLQAGMYSSGLKAQFPEHEIEFTFAAVDNCEPFRSCLYSLELASMQAAIKNYTRSVRQLAHCIETNDFSEPCEKVVTPISIRPRCFADNFDPEVVDDE